MRERVVVPAWYSTIFYGLKRNHPLNASVVHPLLFLLRRILFAIIIVGVSQERMLISAFMMLYMTLAMLLIAATALPWTNMLINGQHIVNECVFYTICASIVALTGAITEVKQSTLLGWMLVGLVSMLIIFNLVVVTYDMLSYIKLLLIRYNRALPPKLRHFVLENRSNCCFCFCKRKKALSKR